MDMSYYSKCYGSYEDIDLPRTHRTYFDALCSEYSLYPIKDKLLDIAYVVTHGFDIKESVRKIMSTHSHVSESNIHRAILDLQAAACHTDSVDDRGNSLDTDIDILVEDLIRNYRLPVDGSVRYYFIDNFRNPSEQEPYRCNGWELASENVNKYRMYREDDLISYPGDIELIRRYHEAKKENDITGQMFQVKVCPEPWYGNPMTAKIIILGNMPMYDDNVSRCANLILSRMPQLSEFVQRMVRGWMCLSGRGMYDAMEFGGDGLRIGDAYNSVTYRHWVDELRRLATETGVDQQQLLDNACVINANAYYTKGGNDPLVAGMLPSQYYLRTLVNYLVNGRKDKPLFIIPSPKVHRAWKMILAWAETDIMVFGEKILIPSANMKLSLSTDVIGKKNGKLVKEKVTSVER